MNASNHPNAVQRQQLLQHLYSAREQKPYDGWLTEQQLKQACGNVAFALDVLVELGWIQRNGFRSRISGPGVLAAEAGWTCDGPGAA